jgi:hypothetical protein
MSRESVTISLPSGALAGWPVLIDALRRAKEATGFDLIFGGLIAQIEAQTTPRPPEPEGLGAVVEDAEGNRWIRRGPTHYIAAEGSSSGFYNNAQTWGELNVARVLSEGVSDA